VGAGCLEDQVSGQVEGERARLMRSTDRRSRSKVDVMRKSYLFTR
jgi:hypothetical protein